MTRMTKLTPLLTVAAIEPCLPFWQEILNFSCVQQVEHKGKMGFAILIRDNVTIMLQTYASVEDDGFMPVEHLQHFRHGRATLYIDVEGLDQIAQKLPPETIICPRRTTFYGADEIFVRDPEGNVIGLAEHKNP